MTDVTLCEYGRTHHPAHGRCPGVAASATEPVIDTANGLRAPGWEPATAVSSTRAEPAAPPRQTRYPISDGHVIGGPLTAIHPGHYIETRVPAGELTETHIQTWLDTARRAGLQPGAPVLVYTTADRGTGYTVLRADIDTAHPTDTPDPEQQR